MTEFNRDDFFISTDKTLLNISVIHDFLANQSYWAKGIPLERVQRSIAGSLCFGVYWQTEQVGFARIISDFSTIAYLGDVFILEPYRGMGLSKWLMQTIIDHPELQGLRRWILGTADAHSLYTQFGFRPMARPDRWMELFNSDVYPAKID